MKKNIRPSSASVTASELAHLAGVSINTVRYYHFLGLLPSKKIAATGRRFFTPGSLDQLAVIRRLNRAGYTLRDIREIFAHRWKK